MRYKRLLSAQKHTFFLLGMRGVGKSTWAKQTFPEAHYINLLLESRYQQYLQNPAIFEAELHALKPKSWIVIDEIQRLPQLLNVVHNSIEEKRMKFVLLGSSARKLRRSGVNLLGGRASMLTMHPLLPKELGKDFKLEKVLQYGSIPLIWNSKNSKLQLDSYMRAYLKEEIQAEAIVKNLPGFARFLPIAGLFHGKVLNVDGLARDAGVARTTVQGYLDILEDTLLAFRLPAFDGKLRVKERTHPKLYWNDNGIARAAKQHTGVASPEERGVLLESFVIQTVKAYAELGLIECDALYYWAATQSSREVDLLIQRGDSMIAVEIKSSTTVHPEMLKGLRAVSEMKNVRRKILVYLGTQQLRFDPKIEVWPLGEFLSLLSNGFR